MAQVSAPGSGATMDAIGQPPPGVILPPKEAREFVEKTATYVIRAGPAFESRMKTDEKNHIKVGFIFEGDPYYPYYVWRKEEVKAGRGTFEAGGNAADNLPKPVRKRGPEPPPEFLFSARMPTINAQDLEVVKLTALYVAKNGRTWMTQLSQRELGNYQFDFLRPQHSLNQFFMRLVDQYSLLIASTTSEGGRAEEARIAEIEKIVEDKYSVLEKARKRAEWVKHEQSQRIKKQELEEAERREYATVDWDDFVILGEIFFTEADENMELPAPTLLNDLQSQSLEQRGNSRLLIEETAPTEDLSQWQHQSYSAPTPAQPFQQPVQYPMYPPMSYGPTPPNQQAFSPPPPPPHSSMQMPYQQMPYPQMPLPQVSLPEAPRSESPATAAPKRIVQNAAPRAAARRGRVQMATCPNCKQQIAYDELEQHMKIELLDPRWREQKAKEAQRAATTNISTVDVANNLKRLASQRTDVFDPVTGQHISAEEEERRKRVAPGTDYNPQSTQPGEGLSVAEQIRLIHEKAAQGQ